MVKATFITGIDTNTLPTKEEFVCYCNRVYLPDVDDNRIDALWKRLNDTGWITCRGKVTKCWPSFAKSTYEKMWREDFGKEYDEWYRAKEEYETERFQWKWSVEMYAYGQPNPRMYDIWFGTDFKMNANGTWSYCALISAVHDRDIYSIFKDSVSEENEMNKVKMKRILLYNISEMLDRLPADAEVTIHSQDKEILACMEDPSHFPMDFQVEIAKFSKASKRVKSVSFRFAGGFHPRNIAITYDEMAYWERVKTREDDGLEVRPYTRFVPTKKKK